MTSGQRVYFPSNSPNQRKWNAGETTWIEMCELLSSMRFHREFSSTVLRYLPEAATHTVDRNAWTL